MAKMPAACNQSGIFILVPCVNATVTAGVGQVQVYARKVALDTPKEIIVRNVYLAIMAIQSMVAPVESVNVTVMLVPVTKKLASVIVPLKA